MKYRVLLDVKPYLTSEMRGGDCSGKRVAKEEQAEWRGAGVALDEEAIVGQLEELIDDHEKKGVKPSRSDAAFSFGVHKCLGLTRRDASDKGLWTYLNATIGWPYVCWRWSGASGVVSTERISGGLDRSSLGRLWWMAELCRGRGEGMAATEEELKERLEGLLAEPDRAVQIYERPRLFARPSLTSILTTHAGNEWPAGGGATGKEKFRRFAVSCGGGMGVRLTSAAPKEELEALLEEMALRARGQ